MTNIELLKAAKTISENCKNRQSCEGCPFWDDTNCKLGKPVKQWNDIEIETSNESIDNPFSSFKTYYAHIDDKNNGWIAKRFFATDLQDVEKQVRNYFSRDKGKTIVVQHKRDVVLRLQIS